MDVRRLPHIGGAAERGEAVQVGGGGEDPVLDWVKGTALRPVLTALDDDPAARDAFVDAYRAALRRAYPAGPHGTPFPFRRVFAVARRPA
jgi:trans-aconitate 2-methyltransferase